MKIYKYILEPKELNILELPKNAQILSAEYQTPNICIWAMVDPAATTLEKRYIETYPTGYADIDNKKRRFINTVVMAAEGMVWHIFELLE